VDTLAGVVDEPREGKKRRIGRYESCKKRVFHDTEMNYGITSELDSYVRSES